MPQFETEPLDWSVIIRGRQNLTNENLLKQQQICSNLNLCLFQNHDHEPRLMNVIIGRTKVSSWWTSDFSDWGDAAAWSAAGVEEC